MNDYKFKDTIIFLKDIEEPLFGSIICNKTTKLNTVIIIKTSDKTLKIPLNKIRLAMFKLDFLRYGFIFKNKIYFDHNVSYWDNQTELIAAHKLQVNFTSKHFAIV